MSFGPLEFVRQICHEILWDVSGGSVNMVSLEVIITGSRSAITEEAWIFSRVNDRKSGFDRYVKPRLVIRVCKECCSPDDGILLHALN